IQRPGFPDSVKVQGYKEPWNKAYITFRKKDQQLIGQMEKQLPAFRNGDSTNVVELYQQRMDLAQQYFRDTPFAPLYYRAIGEYLVKQLEQIKHRAKSVRLNLEQERQAVLQEAKTLNFFTFEVLHAQRAGIRDFTNAYANTFGVADSLEN